MTRVLVTGQPGSFETMFQLAMLGALSYTVLRDGILTHQTFAESLNDRVTDMERPAV